MKERPILFSGPMVRAILDGRKTQTRRIVKSAHADDAAVWRDCGDDWWESGIASGAPGSHGHGEDVRCPYGSPGDRLWVRETWQTGKELDEHSPSKITAMAMEAGYSTGWGPLYYVADGHKIGADIFNQGSGNFGGMFGKVRQSIFMPRWASRLTLEATEVRVQRLQDITEEDARAEGVDAVDVTVGMVNGRPASGGVILDARMKFAALWDAVNGKRAAWASSPWVWALTFRRVP